MAETNAKNRRLRSESPNYFVANASILRPARPRRNADPVGRERFRFADGDLVVPLHDHLATEHAEVLDEVIGKRIVVIDDQNPVIHRSPG